MKFLVQVFKAMTLVAFVSISNASPIITEFSGQKSQVLTIMQNEWGLISAQSPWKYLASNDATSCVMVLWRVQDKSVMALSHFDVATNINPSVNQIISELR